MKQWKQILAAIGLGSLLLFSACGRSGIPADTAGKAEPTPAVETPEPTESPTEAPTETPTPKPTPTPPPEAEGYKHMPETFLIYISGIDVHGDVDTVSRSDVNLVAAVNRTTGKIQVVNTPRDYYVLLPNSNGMRDKLTHAGIYGVEESKGALENLYGLPIDYYVRLNFSGFEEIINALDGIDVYSEYAFSTGEYSYNEGMNHLDGAAALAFVRERKSFAEGDVQRGKNQMEMLRALLLRMTSLAAVQNFEEFYNAVARNLETDLDKDAMLSFIATQILRGTDWDYETYYVTGADSYEETYSIPGANAYVMLPNEEEVGEATKKLQAVLEEKQENAG